MTEFVTERIETSTQIRFTHPIMGEVAVRLNRPPERDVIELFMWSRNPDGSVRCYHFDDTPEGWNSRYGLSHCDVPSGGQLMTTLELQGQALHAGLADAYIAIGLCLQAERAA